MRKPSFVDRRHTNVVVSTMKPLKVWCCQSTTCIDNPPEELQQTWRSFLKILSEVCREIWLVSNLSLRSRRKNRRKRWWVRRKAFCVESDRTQSWNTGKLKDLGNSILGNFGLSLNNFQTVQDPETGSYSINFQQWWGTIPYCPPHSAPPHTEIALVNRNLVEFENVW